MLGWSVIKLFQPWLQSTLMATPYGRGALNDTMTLVSLKLYKFRTIQHPSTGPEMPWTHVQHLLKGSLIMFKPQNWVTSGQLSRCWVENLLTYFYLFHPLLTDLGNSQAQSQARGAQDQAWAPRCHCDLLEGDGQGQGYAPEDDGVHSGKTDGCHWSWGPSSGSQALQATGGGLQATGGIESF